MLGSPLFSHHLQGKKGSTAPTCTTEASEEKAVSLASRSKLPPLPYSTASPCVTIQPPHFSPSSQGDRGSPQVHRALPTDRDFPLPALLQPLPEILSTARPPSLPTGSREGRRREKPPRAAPTQKSSSASTSGQKAGRGSQQPIRAPAGQLKWAGGKAKAGKCCSCCLGWRVARRCGNNGSSCEVRTCGADF